LLLEKEEKMVQEEAKRLGEELAWRRKQRELTRKKTKGKEGRQEKKKKEAMPKQLTQTECGANENAEGNESSVEEPEHPEEKSKDDNKTIPRAGQGTDPSPKAALGQTDAGVALQEDPSSEKESWQESDESVKELHRVEKMLRENKPAQARREGTIEETSGRWDVDSLLDELDETELGRFEHMLTICEGNQQNGTSSSFPPSTLSQQGESESSYHVDEALRFCVEIDAVLADAESVHADSPLGSLAESPNIENIKSRLCASPIKESLLLHLHQKRIERERQGSPRERSLMKQHSSSETKQAGVAPSVPASTFTKENTANNFRRSKRSSSMLSSTLEDKKSMNQLNMSLSGDTNRKPPRDNIRERYYSALRLSTPATPPATKTVPTNPSWRSRTDDTTHRGPTQPTKNETVRRTITLNGPAATSATLSGNLPSRSVLVGKSRRPVWARDSDNSSCCLCRTEFSLTLRRHHCRACGRIFCSKCLVKANVPELDYHTPVPVCLLCRSTLPQDI